MLPFFSSRRKGSGYAPLQGFIRPGFRRMGDQLSSARGSLSPIGTDLLDPETVLANEAFTKGSPSSELFGTSTDLDTGRQVGNDRILKFWAGTCPVPPKRERRSQGYKNAESTSPGSAPPGAASFATCLPVPFPPFCLLMILKTGEASKNC